MTSAWDFSADLLLRLRRARRVVAFTGAGVSAESGVPTFRGHEGLWAKYKPEELATPSAFAANPELVWEWYSYRRKLIAETEPNPGHYALAAMERHVVAGPAPTAKAAAEGPSTSAAPATSAAAAAAAAAHVATPIAPVAPAATRRDGQFTLITQNVDGLHARAGSRRILELHGNILQSFCGDCEADHPEVKLTDPSTAPRCQCGGLIRPGVVWFGEGLPSEVVAAAARATAQAQVFLTIGTSAVVYPAAGFILDAARAGAYVVEVNPAPSDLAGIANERFEGPAGEVLPALVEAAFND